jgi:hypothetical protein
LKKFIILFILAFIVGGLLVGCGDTTKESVSTSVPKSTVDKEVINPSIEVVNVSGGSVSFNYTLENLTSKDQKVVFNGGNKLSYVIYDGNDKEVYNNKVEIESLAVEEFILKKGEKSSFEILSISDFEPGNYSVIANLKGEIEGFEIEAVNADFTLESSIDKNLLEVEGIFVGWADGHTVEITTAKGPVAFQVLADVIDKLSVFEEGDKLTVFYIYDDVTKTIIDVK